MVVGNCFQNFQSFSDETLPGNQDFLDKAIKMEYATGAIQKVCHQPREEEVKQHNDKV